jgi:hypothetical protein
MKRALPPSGTFLAPIRNGALRIAGPLKEHCDAEHWSLFRFEMVDKDHLTMHPVLPQDSSVDFHASLSSDGLLWIPAGLRKTLELKEQSVMLRIEDGAIHVYIRKVFDTLGFRPD